MIDDGRRLWMGRYCRTVAAMSPGGWRGRVGGILESNSRRVPRSREVIMKKRGARIRRKTASCALRFDDPNLDSGEIAHGLGVSLRLLQKVFAERGETVMGRLWEERVSRAGGGGSLHHRHRVRMRLQRQLAFRPRIRVPDGNGAIAVAKAGARLISDASLHGSRRRFRRCPAPLAAPRYRGRGNSIDRSCR